MRLHADSTETYVHIALLCYSRPPRPDLYMGIWKLLEQNGRTWV